jgi:hypothetical protein
VAVGGSFAGSSLTSRSTKQVTQQQIDAASADMRTQIEANADAMKTQIAAAAAATEAQVDAALTTLREQIEADRQNRIWKKRAAAYVEAIKLIRRQQEIRSSQVRRLSTGDEARTDMAPFDRRVIEAGLIAYGSGDVLDALAEATTAGERFARDFWAVERMGPSSERGELVMQARREALDATDLEEKTLDLIRAELQARAANRPLPPLPRSRLGIAELEASIPMTPLTPDDAAADDADRG